MPYSVDMEEAANRHYDDGRKLLNANRYDNAGYHFGLAAECAIKETMKLSKVRDDDDAMWAHFPTLKNLALQTISGRTAANVRRLLERDNFMQHWDIKMRYANSGAVIQPVANRWCNDANEAIGLLL